MRLPLFFFYFLFFFLLRNGSKIISVHIQTYNWQREAYIDVHASITKLNLAHCKQNVLKIHICTCTWLSVCCLHILLVFSKQCGWPGSGSICRSAPLLLPAFDSSSLFPLWQTPLALLTFIFEIFYSRKTKIQTSLVPLGAPYRWRWGTRASSSAFSRAVEWVGS